METRLWDREVDNLKSKFNLFGFSVASQGRSSVLALLWCKKILVTLQSYSNHHIDVFVQLINKDDIWRFTSFYGEPDGGETQTNLECPAMVE